MRTVLVFVVVITTPRLVRLMGATDGMLRSGRSRGHTRRRNRLRVRVKLVRAAVVEVKQKTRSRVK